MFLFIEIVVVMKICIKFISMWNIIKFKLIGIEFIIYWYFYCSLEIVG